MEALAKRGSILGGMLAALVLALLLGAVFRSNGESTPTAPAVDPTGTTLATIRFWEHRVQRDSRDFLSYNKLAGLYIRRARQTGDIANYQRAEAALTASLASLPGPNYQALVQLALVYGAQHRFTDALPLAEEAVALRPTEAFGYGVLGDAQLALGRYEEAYESYVDMAAMAPGLAAFSRLAYLLELRGELDAAALNWRNAVGIDSGRRVEDSAWAHVQLGRFHFNTGDLGAAQAAYEAALAAFPDYVHAVAGLANVRAARGDYDEAIALYSKVVERYPVPEYVALLGDVYLTAGREAEAAEQYALVAAIDRLYKANGVNTDLQMALFFADHERQLEEALRQARAAYAERHSIQAADVLAWTLYKSGRYGEALPYAEEALRLGTRDALMLFHAGMIHYRLGDETRARQYLAQAVQVNRHFSLLYGAEAVALLSALPAPQRGN